MQISVSHNKINGSFGHSLEWIKESVENGTFPSCTDIICSQQHLETQRYFDGIQTSLMWLSLTGTGAARCGHDSSMHCMLPYSQMNLSTLSSRCHTNCPRQLITSRLKYQYFFWRFSRSKQHFCSSRNSESLRHSSIVVISWERLMVDSAVKIPCENMKLDEQLIRSITHL